MEILFWCMDLVCVMTRVWVMGFPWKEVGLWSKSESFGFEERVVVAMVAMEKKEL